MDLEIWYNFLKSTSIDIAVYKKKQTFRATSYLYSLQTPYPWTNPRLSRFPFPDAETAN